MAQNTTRFEKKGKHFLDNYLQENTLWFAYGLRLNVNNSTFCEKSFFPLTLLCVQACPPASMSGCGLGVLTVIVQRFN